MPRSVAAASPRPAASRASSPDRGCLDLPHAGPRQPEAARPARGPAAGVRDIAWKGQLRLCQRYRHLMAAGKPKVVVTTAIAREMVGFIWAIARTVAPARA